MGRGTRSSIGWISVLFLDLLLLKRRSMSYSVISPFLGLMVVLRGLLLMVLLSLAELFFQSALELIALRICETSVVRVAIGTPSLFFLRLTWFYLCIYSITTIIILLIYHTAFLLQPNTIPSSTFTTTPYFLPPSLICQTNKNIFTFPTQTLAFICATWELI